MMTRRKTDRAMLANCRMTDAEVDSLPVVRYGATEERMKMRKQWGLLCGRKAKKMGTPKHGNPFSRLPQMTMCQWWFIGWDEEKEG